MGTIKHIVVLICLLTTFQLSAVTANNVMAKAASKANEAVGITCKFVLTSSGKTLDGTLKASGKKFVISTKAVSSWYNGKYLWTYNASSGETTLISPSKEELSESNPLDYLKTYPSNFNVSFSSKKISGMFTVLLTPKSRKNPVRQVEIQIGNKSYKPAKFTITAKSGDIDTVNIISLDYNRAIKSSEFEYPENKYPGIQIIDLR